MFASEWWDSAVCRTGMVVVVMKAVTGAEVVVTYNVMCFDLLGC